MAGKGCKARGGLPKGKWCVRRHGGGTHGKRRRGASSCEKALETVERRVGRKAALDGLREYREDF